MRWTLTEQKLTEWNVMIWIKWNVLFDFGLVHTLQDSQPMSHTGNTHFLQFIMFESDESFADNFILCTDY